MPQSEAGGLARSSPLGQLTLRLPVLGKLGLTTLKFSSIFFFRIHLFMSGLFHTIDSDVFLVRTTDLERRGRRQGGFTTVDCQEGGWSGSPTR